MIQAAGVVAFNLLCTVTGTYFDREPQPLASFTLEYRIDLEAGRFCQGACAKTRAIAYASPTMLFLTAHDARPNGEPLEHLSINRKSGVLVWSISASPGEVQTFAQCERRKFSGFPQRRF